MMKHPFNFLTFMTPVSYAIVFAVVGVVLLAIGLFLQFKKLGTFHKDFFSGAEKGLLDTMSASPIDEPGLTQEQRLGRSIEKVTSAVGGGFGGVFKGVVPIVFCVVSAMLCFIGFVTSLVFHFMG